MNTTITVWKNSLSTVLGYYEAKRGSIYIFYPILFLFFILVNIACYWWAMFTGFPKLTHGAAGQYYFKVQFPVGILGALFDSLSFFVTIFIVRHAIHTKKNMEYISHLSLDLVIAILATFWVLFIFSFSGWIIQQLEPIQSHKVYAGHETHQLFEGLSSRNEEYTEMLMDALESPTDNKRNIYFGLIMGVSAMLPTCGHVLMFIISFFRINYRKRTADIPLP